MSSKMRPLDYSGKPPILLTHYLWEGNQGIAPISEDYTHHKEKTIENLALTLVEVINDTISALDGITDEF